MGETKILSWNEIEPAAKEALSVWMSGGDMVWAEQAWAHITNAGRANYVTELERCRAAVRAFALFGIYLDYCAIAQDESLAGLNYKYWADELAIMDFTVGQLIGSHPDFSNYGDEFETVDRALHHLADEARIEIYPVLRDGFGNVPGLYVSLWRSANGVLLELAKNDSDDLDEDTERAETITDEEIFQDVDGPAVAVYAWLDDGCPPYR